MRVHIDDNPMRGLGVSVDSVSMVEMRGKKGREDIQLRGSASSNASITANSPFQNPILHSSVIPSDFSPSAASSSFPWTTPSAETCGAAGPNGTCSRHHFL